MNNHQIHCRFTAPKLSRVHSCTCVHRPLIEAGILSPASSVTKLETSGEGADSTVAML
jgi:hypothetical protein